MSTLYPLFLSLARSPAVSPCLVCILNDALFQEEWDPAVLHLDPKLLRDFVILFMSATLGGVCAAGFGLPDTLGYIVGGMIVGPTGVDVIRMVSHAQRGWESL